TIVASHSSTPVPSTPLPTTSLTLSQYRFCNNSVKSLKKLKDAAPFLRPVDPVALNVPHYPTIIKTPMDLGTIERKVATSNPQKPDLNSSNPRYSTPDEFVADVRLVFENCYKFNGPDHTISAMGRRVEEVFERQVKNMPMTIEVATPPPPPPPPPVPTKKAQPVRRASTSVPVIRRNDNEAVGRPKREIHPPPPKDLPYADAPKKHRKARRVKDDGTAEQLKFCSKILQDLSRKQHWDIASPFYEPVDWVNLDLPTYPKIVKKPMDMSTMRKKLENGDYPNAQKFCDDFKLMIRNCFAFNPQGTPVNTAGIELQRLFDSKWRALPPLHEVTDDEEDEEDISDDEHSRMFLAHPITYDLGAIAVLEDQMRAMNDNLTALKNLKANKDKKKPKKEKPPHPSTSKPSKPKPLPPPKNGKKSGKKAGVAENDFLTFDQKKDLSEAIQGLDGVKLERVIKIIHEGVPEIRDSTEEIELEIDLLPPPVLTKLYNFVIRPLRAPPVKRNRHGKGTGTGGLNRKSMDEDVEAEKIRQLEQRMALFEGASGAAVSVPKAMDSESDSSSASDSSGSDSE
ncbi:Bromodomain-containing protein, partial [Guyanagaster necrorhizus]